MSLYTDTRGFSESKKLGALVAAIQACILGQVANEEEIDLNKSAQQWQERNKNNATKASFIFCVADATLVPEDGNPKADQLKEIVHKNLIEIRNFCLNENIGMATFLTNCDRLDQTVSDDVSNLYFSRKVQSRVEAFSKMIDLPSYRMYPVVNYWNETNVTDEMAMQAIIPLKECLLDIRSKIFS